MLTIRPAQWPQDIALLSGLDTAFTTARIYRPAQAEWSFRLIEEVLTPPLTKRYDLQPGDPDERRHWDYTALAESDGRLAGFAAAEYVAWNRRVVLWHLYVAPDCRRCGVGTRLLAAVETYALSVEARCLWLETQNVNYPAIQFYLQAGFLFCGFDSSLYDPQSVSPAEIALFFARPAGSAPLGTEHTCRG